MSVTNSSSPRSLGDRVSTFLKERVVPSFSRKVSAEKKGSQSSLQSPAQDSPPLSSHVLKPEECLEPCKARSVSICESETSVSTSVLHTDPEIETGSDDDAYLRSSTASSRRNSLSPQDYQSETSVSTAISTVSSSVSSINSEDDLDPDTRERIESLEKLYKEMDSLSQKLCNAKCDQVVKLLEQYEELRVSSLPLDDFYLWDPQTYCEDFLALKDRVGHFAAMRKLVLDSIETSANLGTYEVFQNILKYDVLKLELSTLYSHDIRAVNSQFGLLEFVEKALRPKVETGRDGDAYLRPECAA